MKFINIGYGNAVSAERIISVVGADSSPIKRLIQDAKEDGRAIDTTCGKKTRSVIITDSNHVIMSPISPETILGRLEGSSQGMEDETEARDDS